MFFFFPSRFLSGWKKKETLRCRFHSSSFSLPVYGDSILSPLQTTTLLSCQSGTWNRKFVNQSCYSTPGVFQIYGSFELKAVCAFLLFKTLLMKKTLLWLFLFPTDKFKRKLWPCFEIHWAVVHRDYEETPPPYAQTIPYIICFWKSLILSCVHHRPLHPCNHLVRIKTKTHCV